MKTYKKIFECVHALVFFCLLSIYLHGADNSEDKTKTDVVDQLKHARGLNDDNITAADLRQLYIDAAGIVTQANDEIIQMRPVKEQEMIAVLRHLMRAVRYDEIDWEQYVAGGATIFNDFRASVPLEVEEFITENLQAITLRPQGSQFALEINKNLNKWVIESLNRYETTSVYLMSDVHKEMRKEAARHMSELITLVNQLSPETAALIVDGWCIKGTFTIDF